MKNTNKIYDERFVTENRITLGESKTGILTLRIVNSKVRKFWTGGYVGEARRLHTHKKKVTKNTHVGSNMVSNNALHQK